MMVILTAEEIALAVTNAAVAKGGWTEPQPYYADLLWLTRDGDVVQCRVELTTEPPSV